MEVVPMEIDPPSFKESNDFDESLFPLTVLSEELKTDDPQLRLNAISRISNIALTLGPIKTRNELLTFIDEKIEGEDELLSTLAEKLGDFVDLVGGPTFSHLILAPLENLAILENSSINNKAVESIIKITEVLSDQQIEKHVVPLIKRLSSKTWFTGRVSSASLIACIYLKTTPDIQKELRNLFISFRTDESSAVRRAVGNNLPELAKVIGKDFILSDGLETFKCLMQDKQDSVRLLMIGALVAFSQAFTPEECNKYFANVVQRFCLDKSWRVKFMLAENIIKICEAFGPHFIQGELLEVFRHLSQDKEAEVRTCISGQILGLAKFLSADIFISNILPGVFNLSMDTSYHVRCSLASNISELVPFFGREFSIEHIVPLFFRLLRDDFPLVRLNIISNIEQVNTVLGLEFVTQNLLPAIFELAEDKSWRIRLAIIEYLPSLAIQMGVDFFDEKLKNISLSWLGDSVFAIRQVASENLRKLTEAFGADWAHQNILPFITPLSSNSNHIHRMTTLLAITTIAPSTNPDILQNTIIPAILSLAKDPVPNIRFNVAKSFQIILPLITKTASLKESESLVKEVLEALTLDSDEDVKYFASKALSLDVST